MSASEKYEAVIGLEVHIQLLTDSKAYSYDAAEYGAPPNTDVSVITLGHPGTLPRFNERVAEFAVLLGLACKCDIREENRFARKNYFYPDLPKGYQISQFDTPICTGGFIKIKMPGTSNVGAENLQPQQKKISITRIHMEEDAGKSIHDIDPFHTLVDLNRAGVPLLEMVSEPEIRSADEAYQYVSEVRKLVRYLGICDGNMEEGSLRCDANISVRIKGEKEFGKKVEVKNMNSIRNVHRAIEHEIKRQIEIIESGGTVHQDTRSFDAPTGKTFSMRSKEMAHDYRYFTEPDLPPLIITNDFIESVRKKMPALPEELFLKFTKKYSLSEYDADVITESKETALWFEELCAHTKNYKAAANFIIGPIKSWLNENGEEINSFPVKQKSVAALIELIDSGKISNTAAQSVFREMILRPEENPEAIATRLNLIQESDMGMLGEYVKQAIAKYPDKVNEYKAGKQGLLGLFMGEVMKLSGGKADPKVASKLVKEELEK
ncbi:MAG TPA: Asp-tRNA(Asn)/Glu-tRNA(Gln) amidotransferase subunit GatB [Bacteroidia bacterium]|nr:Asp-tRNA(Asn)/Glu-tRNA(Gln) amidotransferase subunit GatB [Bacteroidia bacterium]